MDEFRQHLFFLEPGVRVSTGESLLLAVPDTARHTCFMQTTKSNAWMAFHAQS
jgi:hypothetical protein